MYECIHCGYITNIRCNFDKHKNRKNPCNRSVKRSSQKGGDDPQKGGDDPQIVGYKEYICKLCNKSLSNAYNLKRHTETCKGHDSKTCKICKLTFASTHGRFIHNKNVKCKPPIDYNNTLLHTHNNNTTNNINTQNNINNTQNININVFGKEDLSYLLEDKDLLQKVKHYGKQGVYGLAKMIEDVHFNVERPQNHTIIKPDEYGDGVYIRGDDQKWEFREFEDIRDELVNTLSKYIKMYTKKKNVLGVRLIDKRERRLIEEVGYLIMTLDGDLPEALFEELDIDDEVNEEDVKNVTRKFDKSTMKKLHSKTSFHYKKENGEYIIKS
jgi:hypothetical protein